MGMLKRSMENYKDEYIKHRRYMKRILESMTLKQMRERSEFVTSLYHTEDYLLGLIGGIQEDEVEHNS